VDLQVRAMDTAEDVILRFVRHEMHYPNNSSGRLRLLPPSRNEWRFQAEFSDGSTSKQWMLWAEAKQIMMAALDTYAAEHKLKLSATLTSVKRAHASFHSGCHTWGLLW
jgi:hypothetical protein